MKFVKIIFLILIFTVTSSLAVLNYIRDSEYNYKDPLDSTKSTFYQNLKFALSTNNINPSSPIAFNHFTGKITFTVQDNLRRNSKVILSVDKDPFIQSASLQKIFSEATIRNRKVSLIDLSLNHPYVTFQDN